MKLTFEQSRKLAITRRLVIIGLFLGLLYPVFSDGLTSIYPFINGAIIGISIASLVGFFEFIVFEGSFKNVAFYQIFLIRVVSYTISVVVIIFMVFIIYRMLYYDLNFIAVLKSEEFQDFVLRKDFKVVLAYAFGIVALTNFTMQISRKMGQGVLWGFITGLYYHPREVERIIMFISIQDSKEIIEKIGRLKYHKYLKEIHFDITNLILYHKGIIYEYVDSDLVVLWKRREGLENVNCVRLFFDIKNKLEAEKIHFFEKYGVIPDIRASLHLGTVIRGEIGDIKSEIRYSGDAMNTAARILGQTSAENEFLASITLMERVNLPPIYKADYIGTVELKGKRYPLALEVIKEKEMKMY